MTNQVKASQIKTWLTELDKKIRSDDPCVRQVNDLRDNFSGTDLEFAGKFLKSIRGIVGGEQLRQHVSRLARRYVTDRKDDELVYAPFVLRKTPTCFDHDVAYLALILHNEDMNMASRFHAAELLAYLKNEEVIPTLLDALKYEDLEFKEPLLDAIFYIFLKGEVKNKEILKAVVSTMISMSESDSYMLRDRSLIILCEAVKPENTDAIDHLIEVAENIKSSGQRRYRSVMFESVVKALGKQGSAATKAIPVLKKAYYKSGWHNNDRPAILRDLKDIGTKEALAVLEELESVR